jgi:hypothetical protein
MSTFIQSTLDFKETLAYDFSSYTKNVDDFNGCGPPSVCLDLYSSIPITCQEEADGVLVAYDCPTVDADNVTANYTLSIASNMKCDGFVNESLSGWECSAFAAKTDFSRFL